MIIPFADLVVGHPASKLVSSTREGVVVLTDAPAIVRLGADVETQQDSTTVASYQVRLATGTNILVGDIVTIDAIAYRVSDDTGEQPDLGSIIIGIEQIEPAAEE